MTVGPVVGDNIASVREQLEKLGLGGKGAIHRNLPPAELIARSLARAEGILAANGALVVKTGEPSGRSPKDRVIVEQSPVKDQISWGDINVPCTEALFDKLLDKGRISTDRANRLKSLITGSTSKDDFADADFVSEHTGFTIGGVAPIAPGHPIATVVDVSLSRYDQVWAAAGHPRAVFPTSYDELLRLTGGQPAEVA